MDSLASAALAHHELISTFTELWTLIDDLAIFEDQKVLLPPHPEGSFNVPAALEAGISQEAIDVMQLLPYVEDRFDFMRDTSPICYVMENPDVNSYSQDRAQFDTVNDELIPASAFKLSFTNIYHYVFVYDTANKLVYPWKPFDDMEEPIAYTHVTGQPAREIFQPVIDSYRKFVWMGSGDGHVEFLTQEEYDRGSAKGWEDQDRDWGQFRLWYYAHWQAIRKLQDIYIDCGWDVNATVSPQPWFRRAEFIKRRERYWREIVPVLQEIEEQDPDEVLATVPLANLLDHFRSKIRHTEL